MDAEGTLQTIAEVGVALAGFAALVALFRRSAGTQWTPAARSALRFMIEMSLATVVFALLPFPLWLAGVPDAQVWFGASLLLLILGIGYVVFNTRRIRALYREGWRPPTIGFHVVGFSIGVLSLTFQAWNLFVAGPALYVAGLLIMVLLVGLQFLAFVASPQRQAA